MPNSGPLTTEHTVTGLIDGETATFLVRAVNSTGAGSATTVSVELSPLSPLATPALVTPTHTPTLTARAGDGEVTLSWDEPNAIQCTWQYQQTRVSEIAVAWEPIPDSRTFTTEYTVGSLTNGQTYFFKVRAVNSGGQGPASASVSVTPTAGGHSVPPQPTGLSVQVPVTPPDQPVRRGGQLDVSWDAVSATPAVDGYTLRYQSQAVQGVVMSDWSDWCILPDALAAGTTRYTHTGLSGNTRYRYQVRATNAQGHGAWSTAFPEGNDVPMPNSLPESPVRRPSAPQNVAAIPANESVALTWEAPESNGGATITGYKYRYRAASTRWAPSAEGAPLGRTTRHMVDGLTNGTAYTFEVWVVNSAGASASASVTATPAGVPDAPAHFMPSPGAGQVVLRWEAAPANGSAIERYEVRWRVANSGHGWPEWATVSGGSTARDSTVTGLTNGAEYEFAVRAVNGVGAGASASQSARPAAWSGFVSFGVVSYQATEGGARASITVSLAPAPPQTVLIPVVVLADAGTEADDYAVANLTNGTVSLSFAAGASSQSFTLTANEDADADDETVSLSFGSLPSGVRVVGTTQQATVWLLDNDEDLTPAFSSSGTSRSTTVGSYFSFTRPSASGGNGSLRYSVSGSCAGLTATSSSVSGQPTSSGQCGITWTVRDADGDTDTYALQVSVAADTTPTFSSSGTSRSTTVGSYFSFTRPSASGGNGSLRYSVSGSCAGLRATSSSVSGQPTSPGQCGITWTVRDSDGDTDTFALQLSVHSPGS